MSEIQQTAPVVPAVDSTPPAAGSGRLLSLDVFRGLTLAAMLIANNPGDWKYKFPAFEHAEWHGCTFTDLIFPGFVFIMGVAMTFSFGRRLTEGGNGKLFMQVIRRTLILIGLGMALAGFSYLLLHKPDSPRAFRFPGVLQRIALCYFFASLVLMSGLRARGQAVVVAILLVGYHIVMKYVPVPGFGPGDLRPEGANMATWLDDRIFGNHAYKFFKDVKLWHDPEGLLSTIPAIATALLGTITGYTLRNKETGDHQKVSSLMVWGFALVVVGLIWSYLFPLNKNLWSPSFVLFAGGWSLLGLGASYWLLDIRQITWWSKPFLILGTNAIFTYFTVGIFTILSIYLTVGDGAGGEIAIKTWLYKNLVESWLLPLAGPNAASLGYGIFYIAFFTLLVGMLLYRKRIFIKV